MRVAVWSGTGAASDAQAAGSRSRQQSCTEHAREVESASSTCLGGTLDERHGEVARDAGERDRRAEEQVRCERHVAVQRLDPHALPHAARGAVHERDAEQWERESAGDALPSLARRDRGGEGRRAEHAAEEERAVVCLKRQENRAKAGALPRSEARVGLGV